MSTITVTNIKATGETNSRAVSGIAAVLCHYDQNASPVSVESSVNVSSVVDDTTGRSTVNINNDMGNVNYITVSGAGGTVSNFTLAAASVPEDSYAVGSYRVEVVYQHSTGAFDAPQIMTAVFGDLA